ncbi:SusE domain-containing protein [Tenacibaculum sp. IB213877]|uniref:SusE domain-containing protein n=1 Tax=Tenacibaculum sp. IB213877 TaxID=3097351 RepID=UPI002A59A662|nr:SusE domain-containing protein [Tenacibaculum sp. IB213877]MDY0779483.1 SusE domain-containing protein [Tenacibaculum sp. IB213877]
MKKTLILTTLVIILGLIGCQNNENLDYIVDADPNGIELTNTLATEYTLSKSDGELVIESFSWNAVNFLGTPTVVGYEIQYATTEDFASPFSLVKTTETTIDVTVNDFITAAEYIGLDADPNTEEKPNTGNLYFRVRAYVGNGGNDSPENVSSSQQVTFILPEVVGSGIEISTWGIVGSGYNNWGATPDAPFYTTDQEGIIVSYVTLIDGEIKFRENNDWANNYGDTGADGTLEVGGDNLVVTAGSYKITLNLNDLTYTMEPFSIGIVGSAYNDWGATPDFMLEYDYYSDVFRGIVTLLDGEMKFRMNNAWDINYGDTGADGTLEIGGDNIITTNGIYIVTVDLNNNLYTLEEIDNVWGLVGSAYNDWGATPDAQFTRDWSQPNDEIWILKDVTLLDGEYKFRANNAWDVNYGDTGADGTLEVGGDNLISTAGTYTITLNFSDPDNPTYTIE